MDVKLYGRETCKLCKSAAQKLDIMKIPYEKLNIDAVSEPHEGWREDGSIDAQAKHCLINANIPMIMIDGVPFNYTAAMRELKARKAGS